MGDYKLKTTQLGLKSPVMPCHVCSDRTADNRNQNNKNKLKLRESTFYTHMWRFAEVSETFFTVLRVCGPILRHSYYARATQYNCDPRGRLDPMGSVGAWLMGPGCGVLSAALQCG